MNGAHPRARPGVPLLAIVGGILMVVVLGPRRAGLGATWLWMQESGCQAVFRTSLATRLAVGVGVALLGYAFLRANLWLAQVRHRPQLATGDIAALTGLRARAHERRLAVLAGVVALFLGAVASGGWLAVLRLLHRV